MTVAASQFTLPLAMLNLKVRASGGLAVCLKKTAAALFGVPLRLSAQPRPTVATLP